MRPALLLIPLLCIACRSRIQPERETEIFGGVGVTGVPEVGVSVTAGQFFSKRLDKSDFAFELRATYQGGEDSPTQSGRFFQIQAGVKQILSPGHPRRVFVRYGATWFRATGNPNLFDTPGDYLGVFGGVGYEWQLTPHLTLSPEVSVAFANGEGSLGSEVLPQATLNLLFDF